MIKLVRSPDREHIMDYIIQIFPVNKLFHFSEVRRIPARTALDPKAVLHKFSPVFSAFLFNLNISLFILS